MSTILLLFALCGAIIGSFINVVIYRLPRILAGEEISLSWPPSFCPHCQQRIPVRYNIPLLGWLIVGGRSRCCHQPVSLRYPAVELLLALLFPALVWLQGLTLPCMLDLCLLALLTAMLFIDYDHQLLPDKLTLPFIILAALSAHLKYASPEEILIAAGLGFMVPWSLNRLFLWRSGHAGMGAGDMKLFAGVGAWFGGEALFNIMLIASLIGIVSGWALFKVKRNEAFPFGPAIIIAAAGWLFYQ